jgi:uncharacterized membrane protein YeaQ/YmgE (transglycosylase-associated protein family)
MQQIGQGRRSSWHCSGERQNRFPLALPEPQRRAHVPRTDEGSAMQEIPFYPRTFSRSRALWSNEHRKEGDMAFDGIGWLAAIIIGGLAGWLAGRVMSANTGLLMNIILGIVGAIVASALLGVLGVSFGGWVGYLIAGFIGACILIAIGRAVSGRRI